MPVVKKRHRPADIAISSEWMIFLIFVSFSIYLLVIGVILLRDNDNFGGSVCLISGAIASYGMIHFRLITTRVFISEQVIEWSARSIRYGVEKKVIPFSHVQRVHVQTGGRRGISKRLVLKCKHISLPLAETYSRLPTTVNSLREQILEALTMKVDTIDDFERELSAFIESKDTIKAVKYIRHNKGLSLLEAKKYLEEAIKAHSSKNINSS